ncbi:hypothetical protein HDU93_008786 [Gonapodya sp. JEL0774]|nr:hypothetical protein HDU93_008786 [Gonapodya sp. JEL0774]
MSNYAGSTHLTHAPLALCTIPPHPLPLRNPPLRLGPPANLKPLTPLPAAGINVTDLLRAGMVDAEDGAEEDEAGWSAAGGFKGGAGVGGGTGVDGGHYYCPESHTQTLTFARALTDEKLEFQISEDGASFRDTEEENWEVKDLDTFVVPKAQREADVSCNADGGNPAPPTVPAGVGDDDAQARIWTERLLPLVLEARRVAAQHGWGHQETWYRLRDAINELHRLCGEHDEMFFELFLGEVEDQEQWRRSQDNIPKSGIKWKDIKKKYLLMNEQQAERQSQGPVETATSDIIHKF